MHTICRENGLSAECLIDIHEADSFDKLQLIVHTATSISIPLRFLSEYQLLSRVERMQTLPQMSSKASLHNLETLSWGIL